MFESVRSPNPLDSVRSWADFYRSIGLNALPSRSDAKRPPIPYSAFWEADFPPGDFYRVARREVERRGSVNLQVMTGRRWGLCAIDLDGPEAIETWRRWTAHRPCPSTWAVGHDMGGRHLWFSLPSDIGSLPSRLLWASPDDDRPGQFKKHVAIELIGDRKLLVSPPSRHPETGRRYRFLEGRGPADLTRPAPIPAWVLGLPDVRLARKVEELPLLRREVPLLPLRRPDAGRWDRMAVEAAIGDPRPLAASWGLRLAGADYNAAGWLPCHAAGREDRDPSAAFSRLGCYWEPGAKVISLFDLSVLLGAFSDWRDCVDDLGRRFGVPPTKELQRVG